MRYEHPPSFPVAFANYERSLRKRFHLFRDPAQVPPRNPKCTFCNYGAKNKDDAARILYDTGDYLLVDRPYTFDAALHTDVPKNTAMSFLHILVVPKKHIPSAAQIPTPEMISTMRSVFLSYLSSFPSSSPVPSGQQPPPIQALIDREKLKVSSRLSVPGISSRLEDDDTSASEVLAHLDEHVERLANGPRLGPEDFVFYFHLPPSIWHLHMHVALNTEAAREHAVGFIDQYSIEAGVLEDELRKVQRSGM